MTFGLTGEEKDGTPLESTSSEPQVRQVSSYVVIQVRSFPSPGINCKTNDVSVKNLLHKDEARLIPRM